MWRYEIKNKSVLKKNRPAGWRLGLRARAQDGLSLTLNEPTGKGAQCSRFANHPLETLNFEPAGPRAGAEQVRSTGMRFVMPRAVPGGTGGTHPGAFFSWSRGFADRGGAWSTLGFVPPACADGKWPIKSTGVLMLFPWVRRPRDAGQAGGVRINHASSARNLCIGAGAGN